MLFHLLELAKLKEIDKNSVIVLIKIRIDFNQLLIFNFNEDMIVLVKGNNFCLETFLLSFVICYNIKSKNRNQFRVNDKIENN